MRGTLWLVALTLIACGGRKPVVQPNWAQLGQADLPARIATMTFDDGSVTDENKPHRWGVWQGALISETVIDRWAPANPSTDMRCSYVSVGPMSCSNTSTGESNQCWVNMASCENGYRECDICGGPNPPCTAKPNFDYIWSDASHNCPSAITTR